jgi:hypothetical protein
VVSDACSTATCTATFTTPPCYEGCTIGYWKNHTDRWCNTYTPNTLYNNVFVNAPPVLVNKTLLQVLNLGGGGIFNLGRQSVAAILNACYDGVGSETFEYSPPYMTVASIIAAVNQAFISGGSAPGLLGSQLDTLNNVGCPLGGTSATTVSYKTTEIVGFDVYPVPFRDELNIRFNFDYESEVKVEFFDVRGVLIHTETDNNGYNGKVMKLNVNYLNDPGQMYFVRITTDRGSEMKKIISNKS